MMILAVIFSLTSLSENILRIPVTVLFVFTVPGLSIVNNLFFGLSLPFYERLAYGMGLSVATMALGALVLHGLRLGFQTPVWMLFLCGVTVFNLGISLIRARLDRAPEFYRMPEFSLFEVMFYAVAVVIVVLGVMFSVAGDQFQQNRFTELWVMPQSEDETTFSIGIGNHEMMTQSYRIEVMVNRNVVYKQQVEDLGDKLTWEAIVTLPPPAGFGDLVQVLLYRQDNPDEIYRKVYMRR